MKIVEGNIVLLGNSSIKTQTKIYSVIEIGNTILQKITVPISLDNFLGRGLDQHGNSKLYLSGKVLCGIQTPDGKIYCFKTKPISALVSCIFGVPMIPFFGLGLVFIWQGIAELKNHAVTSKLRSMGATALSM